MLLQVPVHLPTFQLSQLVPPVSEFLGLLQPLELLWWGIGYTIRQKEARTLTQPPAVWTLVLVQLNIPCLVFREAFGILSPWLPSHSISQALWLVLWESHYVSNRSAFSVYLHVCLPYSHTYTCTWFSCM